MIHTQDFCTKTISLQRKNANTGDSWGVALDIGYSAVKGMSPNSVFCFPAYARRFTGHMISAGDISPDEIQYRDENGEIWNVGMTAQNMISSSDSNDNLQTLYGRNRYSSDMFKVLARVGLGMSLIPNKHGDPAGKPVVLQTGLPPAYLKSDVGDLKDALSGHHKFAIRIGGGQWINYEFDLLRDNIRVMAQPMGSFFSAVLSNDATQLPSAKSLFNSNVLIFDAGFGTVDIYSIRNRQIESSQSFDDCGMKAVLEKTAAAIYDDHGQEIAVHAMQSALREGAAKIQNRKLKKSYHVELADYLEKATHKVCADALNRIDQMYNYLFDYDYLMVTGGTGAAWHDIISDAYSGMETLKVITASQNDTLSQVFSNVRGYYLFQAGALQRQKKG